MMKRILMTSLALCGLMLAGCYEYRVHVTVNEDGTGRRHMEVDGKAPAANNSGEHTMLVSGDGWRVTMATAGDGEAVRRHSKSQDIDLLEGWRDAGGLILMGNADSPSRLVADCEVERIESGDGPRLVYRETVHWLHIREDVADLVGDNYATALRRQFPALADSLVSELRGVMVTGLIMSWDDLVAAEGDDSREDVVSGRLIDLAHGRLIRAGVDRELATAVAESTTEWDSFDGLEKSLPGLDVCVSSNLVMDVTMPYPILGGNADTVEGNVATFRVDLVETLGGPVVLEVVSGP